MAGKENPYFNKQATKGRPLLILNEKGMETIEKLASIQCIDEEIADVLDTCVDTLLNKNNKEKFKEAKQKGQSKGRVSLRRMQWKSAEGGNVTMQIWLGKQYLNQKEQQEVSNNNDTNMVIEIKNASSAPKELLED